ncbi:hypothetical protein [Halobaculum magnesiiphilum]|uniref:Uncharacterized protein n=1 Tax=Halobaculum magnesiiphilum TaxID=1017351 RepID=A0A8T8WD49_9EURY|nr:hypothetical protein [Halobaculum magnesiiphilum]QZP37751.1 hypothetical protein K6T50_00795 [Halobaculum magnesiiphilum]
MQVSSTTTGDPWAGASTESTGTRHSRAEPALGGSTATTSASNTEAPSGAGNSSGPLVGRIEQSGWTQDDLQLLLQVLQILALLAAAYAAYNSQ